MIPDIDITKAIRGNNNVWYLLYYDELLQKQDYQLSYMENADLGFYNCAHAVRFDKPDDIDDIESFFLQRKMPAAIYIDPLTPDAILQHIYTNYKLVPDEEENWVVYNMDTKTQSLDYTNYLKVDPKDFNIKLIDVRNDIDLGKFIEIDAKENNLPKIITDKLKNHILTRTNSQIEMCYFIGYFNDIAVSTGCVGILDGYAYLAEAATLKDYQRKGFYSALLLARLNHCKNKGVKKAFFTATAGANSNLAALKLGFELGFKRQYYRK